MRAECVLRWHCAASGRGQEDWREKGGGEGGMPGNGEKVVRASCHVSWLSRLSPPPVVDLAVIVSPSTLHISPV